jgi:CheY-like chemotaxis protein
MEGHHILVVEDDPATRSFLSQLLQGRGYRVTAAANGAEAVRRVVEQKPCVILLDFDMPVMDGHDFREVQKRIAPDVPIICLTGAADAAQTARLVGASSVYPKPPNLEALCTTVADLCAQAHEHRHAAVVEASIQQEGRTG